MAKRRGDGADGGQLAHDDEVARGASPLTADELAVVISAARQR